MTGIEPIAEFERVKKVVEKFTLARTKAELLEAALERGLLIAPVATIDEVVNSEQLAARGYWSNVEYPELGRSLTHPGPFAKFSESPLTAGRRAPRIGEHNQEIYAGELGMGASEIAALEQRRVI